MSVLITTNHIMQQSTVMPLTVNQYSADTWHLPYRPGVDQYTKILTHTPSTYIINQHLVRHMVRCGSTCWLIGWSSLSIDRQPTYTQLRGAQMAGVFCRTPNTECRMLNDSEVLWLGLGNGVNQVSGQFSQFEWP